MGDEADEKTRIPRIEAVVRRIYKAAARGSIPAAALIFDRGWGKPTQPVETSGPEGGPLEVLIRYVDGLGAVSSETTPNASRSRP